MQYLFELTDLRKVETELTAKNIMFMEHAKQQYILVGAHNSPKYKANFKYITEYLKVPYMILENGLELQP